MLYNVGATVFTGGQAAIPANLLEQGYKFHYTKLFDALTHELKNT